MRKFSLLSLSLLYIFACLGCGNVMSPNSYQLPSGMYEDSGDLEYTKDVETKYRCPTLSNVVPQSTGTSTNLNSNTTGRTNFYTVCKSATTGNQSDILVHGSTAYSRSICVFPLRSSTSGLPTAMTRSNGQPIVVCGPITKDGVLLSFPSNLSFNTVAIVEGNDENSMSYCLRTQFMSDDCPNYSMGTFR